MKFIDTVTIFHKEKQDTYKRTVIEGCYWYGDSSISIKGNGVVDNDVIYVFFPHILFNDNQFKIHKGDRIVKGDVPMISSVNELSKYENRITVTGVNDNMVGSPFDNVLVTGK